MDNIVTVKNQIYVGERSDIDSLVFWVRNELKSIIGTEVYHENKPYIVKDIGVINDGHTISITSVLELSTEHKEYLDIINRACYDTIKWCS